jgi:hypothetical protein
MNPSQHLRNRAPAEATAGRGDAGPGRAEEDSVPTVVTTAAMREAIAILVVVHALCI